MENIFVHGSSAAHKTLELARNAAAQNASEMNWWNGVNGPENEAHCAICEAWNQGHMESPERHPQRVCPVCEMEAVDELGRSLVFSNQSMSGGFVAMLAETKKTQRQAAASVGSEEGAVLRVRLASVASSSS